LATCVAFLAAPRAGIVRADGALQVTASPQPVDKFPGEADFSISASSSATIAAVTLHFILLPDTTETAANADFTPGTSVQATYVMRTAGNPLYVPPMKTIRYYWTLQDSAGNQVKTDPVDWQYLDTRFNFKTATNGNLTLYYHAGSDADAQRVLQIGRQAIDKAQALDGVTVPYDVRIVAYQTQAELQPALSHVSRAFDPNILGQTLPPDIVILAVGNLTGSDNDDTFRHELTHIVNAAAVHGGFSSSFPLWLDEGLAVNAQNDPGGFRAAVQDAIQNNQTVPIRTLTPGFQGQNPDLFYGEAWSIVHFLVTTKGADKMAQLLAQFKNGATEDDAFSKVYGENRDALYNDWRKSVGLSPVAAQQSAQSAPSQQAPAQPAGSQSQSQSQPQQAPPPTQPSLPQPAQAPQPASAGDSTTTIIVGVAMGVAVLALLGLAVIGGLLLSRRGQYRAP
jgi:hypothetical protein